MSPESKKRHPRSWGHIRVSRSGGPWMQSSGNLWNSSLGFWLLGVHIWAPHTPEDIGGKPRLGDASLRGGSGKLLAPLFLPKNVQWGRVRSKGAPLPRCSVLPSPGSQIQEAASPSPSGGSRSWELLSSEPYPMAAPRKGAPSVSLENARDLSSEKKKRNLPSCKGYLTESML